MPANVMFRSRRAASFKITDSHRPVTDSGRPTGLVPRHAVVHVPEQLQGRE